MTRARDTSKLVTVEGAEKLGIGGGRTQANKNAEIISVKDYPFLAKGDGVTDDTAALLSAKAYAIANLPCTLRIPKGIYLYSNLGNLAYSGLTIEGEGDRETVLKCTASGSALTIDAFASGSPTEPFVQRCNIKNITVEGNSATTRIFDVQGIARSHWENVVARVAESTAGIAYYFRGVMLSRFENLICSTDLDAMSSIPYEGLKLDEGRRAGVSVGNSSNNVFISPYFEGLSIGMRLTLADHNTFIGGSPESCSIYGMLINTSSRYNTFIGVGFENVDSTADIADAGISTRYINIYSSKSILLQGRGAEISGGYFERVEIHAGAIKNRVKDVRVKHWNLGAGGFFDSGTGTEFSNIYDALADAYIYPLKDRAGISVGASPFTYTNTTGQYIEVIVQAGTVTQIRQFRGADNWLKPNSGSTCHLLPPGDALEISYSSAPVMSYVPHNGFQG